MALGDARAIADGGSTKTQAGRTISNLNTGGSEFDIYIQNIPDVITVGQTHPVRYVAVYLRNTQAGSLPLNVSNISIEGTYGVDHNFVLDTSFDGTFNGLLNDQGTKLVPGDVTNDNSGNTAFIKLNDGGTSYVVDDGNLEPSERLEYIDGVTRIIAQGIPASSYRVFIIAEIPDKEFVNGSTGDDLTFTIDGNTTTIVCGGTPTGGASFAMPHIYVSNDLVGATVSDGAGSLLGLTGVLDYDTYLADQKTAPKKFLWDNQYNSLTGDGETTTLEANKVFTGQVHNDTIIGWKATSDGVAASAMLMPINANDLDAFENSLAGGAQSTSQSTGFEILNNIVFNQGISSGTGALTNQVLTLSEDTTSLADGDLFLTILRDNNTGIGNNASQEATRHAALILGYSPNSLGAIPISMASGVTTEYNVVHTAIKLLQNKVNFISLNSDAYGTLSNTFSSNGTIRGNRGNIVAFTAFGDHHVGFDGGGTRQTNALNVSTTSPNLKMSLLDEHVDAGGVNPNALLNSICTTTTEVGIDNATVSASENIDVADGATFTITTTASHSNEGETLNSSTLELPDMNGSLQLNISPPAVIAGSTAYVASHSNVSYSVQEVTTTGWTLRASTGESATPFTYTTFLASNRLDAELMVVCFDPAQSKFVGLANSGSTDLKGDSSSTNGDGVNEGLLGAAGTGAASENVPAQSWLTSLNGRAIDLHSNRTLYDDLSSSTQGVTDLSGFTDGDTFNEFAFIADKTGVNKPSGSNVLTYSHGVVAWRKANGGSDSQAGLYHLGTLNASYARTTSNTPYLCKPFNNYAVDGTTKIPTGLQDFDASTGTTNAVSYYQNMQTMWMYNPGGRRMRIVDITFDSFEHKAGGTSAGVWQALWDDDGDSYDPNVIFLNSPGSGADDGKVSAPIKLLVPGWDQPNNATIGGHADNGVKTAIIGANYTTATARTMKDSSILSPTHEFRATGSCTDNYPSGYTDPVMVGNTSGTNTWKSIPMHFFYDHTFVTNANVKAGENGVGTQVAIASGAMATTHQFRGKVTIKYLTDDMVAATSGQNKPTATTILDDLSNSGGSVLDSAYAPESLTFKVSMMYQTTTGTLSVTDEDGNIAPGTLNFSAR